MGRPLNREDVDVVASSASGSAMFVEVPLIMRVLEVEDEEAVVLSMVDDEIMQSLTIIGEIRSSGSYTSIY